MTGFGVLVARQLASVSTPLPPMETLLSLMVRSVGARVLGEEMVSGRWGGGDDAEDEFGML